MMANRRSAFQQSDVTRALKGAIAAGLDPREISIVLRDGEIRIEPVIAREARTVGANSVDAILNGAKK